MSKIYTKIKGTTYYNIDFSKLKIGTSLHLVRDKQNIHDVNAIRVLYGEIMLGHIEKEVATVLSKIIDSGTKIKAVLLQILGGPPNKYGLLISVSIYENRDEKYYDSGKNTSYVNDIKSFNIIESIVTHNITLKDFKYDRNLYFKQKHKLDYEVIIESKPDFKKLFKSTHGVIDNLFNIGINEYIYNENIKWDLNVKKLTNYNLDIKLKRSEYEKIFDLNDFLIYKKANFIINLFKNHDVSLTDNKKIEEDIQNGYITTYELLLYEKLRNKTWIYRQVIIKGFSVDFLIFNFDNNKCWAVEVDGGIHRTVPKFNRDNECAEELNKIGISLVRVSNSLISRNIDYVVEKILSTIN